MRMDPIKPRVVFARWRGQAIGAFAGRVSDDGSRIVAYAGPSDFEVRDPLPAAGADVTYTLVSEVVVGRPREFVLVAERVKRGRAS